MAHVERTFVPGLEETTRDTISFAMEGDCRSDLDNLSGSIGEGDSIIQISETRFTAAEDQISVVDGGASNPD